MVLDEQLAAMTALWADSPATFEGEFFRFADVWSEPKAWRPEGPRMWFGGERMHPALVQRIVRYGSGFHPFGTPATDDLAHLAAGLGAAGRSLDEIELVGGTRAAFDGPDCVADVDEAMATIAEQLAQGYSLFCMKPSQYTDDLGKVREICHRMVAYLDDL